MIQLIAENLQARNAPQRGALNIPTKRQDECAISLDGEGHGSLVLVVERKANNKIGIIWGPEKLGLTLAVLRPLVLLRFVDNELAVNVRQ
jgi:hypothetical protein